MYFTSALILPKGDSSLHLPPEASPPEFLHSNREYHNPGLTLCQSPESPLTVAFPSRIILYPSPVFPRQAAHGVPHDLKGNLSSRACNDLSAAPASLLSFPQQTIYLKVEETLKGLLHVTSLLKTLKLGPVR